MLGEKKGGLVGASFPPFGGGRGVGIQFMIILRGSLGGGDCRGLSFSVVISELKERRRRLGRRIVAHGDAWQSTCFVMPKASSNMRQFWPWAIFNGERASDKNGQK